MILLLQKKMINSKSSFLISLCLVVLLLLLGPVESQQNSLWELIPMPPPPETLSLSPMKAYAPGEHNYALARYGSATATTTSKFAKFRGSNDNSLLPYHSFPSNKVGNALGNQINYKPRWGTFKKPRKRVLIDPSYTLGCTKEGYFPLPGTCFRFLLCRKSRRSEGSIGYRGFVFRCPLGFYYSGAENGRRCLPLPVSGARQAKCEGNTNSMLERVADATTRHNLI